MPEVRNPYHARPLSTSRSSDSLLGVSPHFAHREETSYFTLSDKIGSNYTPSTRGLTMGRLCEKRRPPGRKQPNILRVHAFGGTEERTSSTKGPKVIAVTPAKRYHARNRAPVFAWNPSPAERRDGDHEREQAETARTRRANTDGISSATEAFWRRAADVCSAGDVTAHKPIWERHIAALMPPVPDVPAPVRNLLLVNVVEEIRDNFVSSVKRSMVEYELRSPRTCAEQGIDPTLLHFPARLPLPYILLSFKQQLLSRPLLRKYRFAQASDWTSNVCCSREWRIERETGVPREFVSNGVGVLEGSLGVTNKVLVKLQELWMCGAPRAPGADVCGIRRPRSHRNAAAVVADEECSLPASFMDVRFLPVAERRFKNMLPLSVSDFSAAVESRAQSARGHLKEKWVSEAAEIMSSHLENAFNEARCHDEHAAASSECQSTNIGRVSQNKLSAERLLKVATTLMSRQLRGSVDASVAEFRSFFDLIGNQMESYTASHYNGLGATGNGVNTARPDVISALLVNVIVDTDAGLVKMDPSMDGVKQAMLATIDKIVQCGRNFPRIDGQAFLSPCEIEANAQSVEDAKCRIAQVVEDVSHLPGKVVDYFRKYEDLFNGKEEAYLRKVVAQRRTSGDISSSLAVLETEVKRLGHIVISLDQDQPNMFRLPGIAVCCETLKDQVRKQIEELMLVVHATLTDDNTKAMESMCEEYSTISTRLVTQPKDSSELNDLVEYSLQADERIQELNAMLSLEVSCRILFACNYDYQMPLTCRTLFQKCFLWPENIKQSQKKSFEIQNAEKLQRVRILDRRKEMFSGELDKFTSDMKNLHHVGSLNTLHIEHTIANINNLKKSIGEAKDEVEMIAKQELLLNQEETRTSYMSRIGELERALEPFETLWVSIYTFNSKVSAWRSNALVEMNAEEAERDADNMRRLMIKLSRSFERNDFTEPLKAAEKMRQIADEFISKYVPLMTLLCNLGLRKRHWEDMAQLTKLPLRYSPRTCLQDMIEVKLHDYVEKIEATCINAQKEFSLEKAMDKMAEEWETMNFEFKAWRTTGTHILSGVDDIQMLLDDHIVKSQAMQSSRFIKPFKVRIESWVNLLIKIQDIIDQWLKVQATWLYLEPIFSSDDIQKQMPTESNLFHQVDESWREAMVEAISNPNVLVVAQIDGMLERWKHVNSLLEQIQKGLNDYLETKRLYFARFFFLSNDELLEILSETKDPLRVQPHLKKCFEGIDALYFEDDLSISAMISPQRERIDFFYDVINLPRICPNESKGCVEVWLLQVEGAMRRSVAYTFDQCIQAYNICERRRDWAVTWQGQHIIGVSQTIWVKETEDVLKENGHSGLAAYWDVCQAQLKDIVELVRTKLPKLTRTKLGAMVTLDVHSRDTISTMMRNEVNSAEDFDWIAQLRYYYDSGGVSATTGKPGSLKVRMITAEREYYNEYLGASARLVVTPLTDRCYRTLMGAVQLNLGGAPEGPAGTGKTETVKDLAKAMAVQCVVFNCSDGLDYLAMGKFFKGLLATGSWCCFDEFNRIELEVLSVIAQQILTIQQGKMVKAESIDFEGTTLNLNCSCNVFITMNPGYAGRTELPDNLKALFRPCAMMVPDYAMIGEIILYSMGYYAGKELAAKIVATFKLCSEQLSSQRHYDYGMRAVIAVLKAAGNLKRRAPDVPEDVLTLQSIIDVNKPKFLSHDLPLFNGIAKDLFPGVKVPDQDRDVFNSALSRVMKLCNL